MCAAGPRARLLGIRLSRSRGLGAGPAGTSWLGRAGPRSHLRSWSRGRLVGLPHGHWVPRHVGTGRAWADGCLASPCGSAEGWAPRNHPAGSERPRPASCWVTASHWPPAENEQMRTAARRGCLQAFCETEGANASTAPGTQREGATGGRATGINTPHGFPTIAPDELGQRKSPQNREGTCSRSARALMRSDPVIDLSGFRRLEVPEQRVRRPPSPRFS